MRGIWPLLIFIVCLFLGLAVGCVAAWRAFEYRGLLIRLLGYAAAGLAADLLRGILFRASSCSLKDQGGACWGVPESWGRVK
jgi:hypothetical protein